jgi:hypothetical protein
MENGLHDHDAVLLATAIKLTTRLQALLQFGGALKVTRLEQRKFHTINRWAQTASATKVMRTTYRIRGKHTRNQQLANLMVLLGLKSFLQHGVYE